MTEVRTFILRLLAVLILASSMACLAQGELPYRFLLVISDQWKDDASLVIQPPNDFQFLAALLKTWGLPFDILRLDQQRLDRYHLLDREGRPLYGTILWNTGAAKVPDQDLDVLEGLVRTRHERGDSSRCGRESAGGRIGRFALRRRV